MPLHRFRCGEGHIFEKVVPVGIDVVDCPTCERPAPKFWAGAWGGLKNAGPAVVHDVYGIGKMTSQQLEAHLADLKTKTGNEYVAEFCHPGATRTKVDEIAHECWELDRAEGESKERQEDRTQQLAEEVKPVVSDVLASGGTQKDAYNAAKTVRATFNHDHPAD